MDTEELDEQRYLPAVPDANLYSLFKHSAFQNLIMKLTRSELKTCLGNTDEPVPIIVWGNFCVSDYALYKALQRRHRKIRIICWDSLEFDEVICRICKKQLQRATLTRSWKLYLSMKWIVTASSIKDANGVSFISKTKLCDIVSEIAELPSSTLFKTMDYVETVDRMYQRDYRFTRAVLGEKPRMSPGSLKVLLQLTDRRYGETKEVIKAQEQIDCHSMERILNGKPLKPSGKKDNAQQGDIRKPIRQHNIRPLKSDDTGILFIKNMPEPDPDAYISSLALTIPSWVNTMNRAHNNTVYSTTSLNARTDLKEQLTSLEQAAAMIRAQIQEVNTNG